MHRSISGRNINPEEWSIDHERLEKGLTQLRTAQPYPQGEAARARLRHSPCRVGSLRLGETKTAVRFSQLLRMETQDRPASWVVRLGEEISEAWHRASDNHALAHILQKSCWGWVGSQGPRQGWSQRPTPPSSVCPAWRPLLETVGGIEEGPLSAQIRMRMAGAG